MFQSKQLIKKAANAGLWLALIGVVVITSVHAITLVMSEVAVTRSPGPVGTILYLARIAFPVVVEACAVVVALGFAGRAWTGWQVWVGRGVELTWLIFATLNMLTAFTVERGFPLSPWQEAWVTTGIPLSALVAGTFLYLLEQVNPVKLRELAQAAAGYFEEELNFSTRNSIRTGAAAQKLIEQKAWLDYVADLRLAGYTDEQIQFMVQFVPQLAMDRDGNGRPDLLDTGHSADLAVFPVDSPPHPTPPPPNRNGIANHYPQPQNQRMAAPPTLD